MIGNTLSEFVDDILTMGGPEKEFLFRGKKYMLQCQKYEANPSLTELVIFECFGDENYVFRCHGKDFRECFEQFEKATIFNGMTIYDAESEIEKFFLAKGMVTAESHPLWPSFYSSHPSGSSSFSSG